MPRRIDARDFNRGLLAECGYPAAKGKRGKVEGGHWLMTFALPKVYEQVFGSSRLKADSRKILLCYKVQFRLRKLVAEITEKGMNKYGFMSRARSLLWALLCQGILNDDKLEQYAQQFGEGLSVEADFTDWLARLASTRCRLIIKEAIAGEPYARMIKEERYGFFRTNAMYKKCMDTAYTKYGWVEKRLK